MCLISSAEVDLRLSGMWLGCAVDSGYLEWIAVGTSIGQTAKLPGSHSIFKPERQKQGKLESSCLDSHGDHQSVIPEKGPLRITIMP